MRFLNALDYNIIQITVASLDNVQRIEQVERRVKAVPEVTPVEQRRA